MGDFTNITLNGKPLVDFLLDQQRREIEMHIASEVAELRRSLTRGRSTPVPLAASRRGRKPMEIRPWVVAEIKALSANQSLTVDDIAFRAGQPAQSSLAFASGRGGDQTQAWSQEVGSARREPGSEPSCGLDRKRVR